MTDGDGPSGLELSRAFFHEAVAPLIARVAPMLRYTAGRFGARSDAMGFDDAISRDHGWGPGCTLLLEPAAFEGTAPVLDAEIRALPRRLGSVNQLSACRDLEDAWPAWRARVAALFGSDREP